MFYNDHTKCFTMPAPNSLQWPYQMLYNATPNALQWPHHQVLCNDHTKCFTITAPNTLQWPHQMLYNATPNALQWPHQVLCNDHTKSQPQVTTEPFCAMDIRVLYPGGEIQFFKQNCSPVRRVLLVQCSNYS